MILKFILAQFYVLHLNTSLNLHTISMWKVFIKKTSPIPQVSYRFLTAENLRLVLSRGSFLLWWRGGLVP